MSTTVNLFMSPLPTAWRKVTSITPAGSAPVRCLTLEDPRGLYITTDGIVTHNSPAKGSLTIGENAAPLKYHDTPDAFANSQAGRDLLARLREADGKDRKITAVALDHRSPIASVVSAFERAFNKRVVFVKGLSSDGLILDDAPGVVFANVEGENPIGFVLGTELREQASAWTDDLPPPQELGELFNSRGEWSGLSEDNADGTPSQRHVVARVANQMLGAMGMDQGLISDVLATYLRSGTFEQRAEKMIDDAQLSTMLGDAPPRANLLESKINLSFDGPDVIMNDQANAELTYYIRERLSTTREVVRLLGARFVESVHTTGRPPSIGKRGESFDFNASVSDIARIGSRSGRGLLTDAKAAVDALIEEELLHLAGLSFMREQWRANPRGLTFDEYFSNEIESIWSQIHRESFENPEVKAAAVASWNIYAHSGIPKAENFRDVATYMQSHPQTREKMILEMSRQMAQLWRSGRISESATEPTGWWNKLKAWLSGALRTLHRAAASLKEGRWGSLLAQHAQNSLDMLAEAESGRTVGTQGNRNGAQITFEAKSGKIDDPEWRHREGEAFQVENLTARTLFTGSALPRIFRALMDRLRWSRNALESTLKALSNDLRTAARAEAKLNGTDELTELNRIAPFMVDDGQHGPGAAQTARASVSDAFGAAAERCRNIIDQLSLAYASTLRGVGEFELANTIVFNQGRWMKRHYACFDSNSNWNWKTMIKKRDSGGTTATGQDVRTLYNNAVAQCRSDHPTWTTDEIDAYLKNLIDRDSFSSASMGQGNNEGLKADISSFMQRGDIPAAYRAWMGEETNPLERFEKSGKFLAQVIATHEQQQIMLNLGLASNLFSDKPTGVYNVEIPTDNLRWSGFMSAPNQNGDRQKFYTTPEMARALETTYAQADLRGDGFTKAVLGWMKGFRALHSEAKINKVALNPGSYATNIIGGFIGVIQTGAAMSRHYLTAAETLTANRSATENELAVSALFTGQARTLMSGMTRPQLEAYLQGLPFTDEQRATAMKLVKKTNHRRLRSRLIGAGAISENFELAELVGGVLERRTYQVLEAGVSKWDRAKGIARGFFTGWSATRGLGNIGGLIGGAVGGAVGGVVGNEKMLRARQQFAEWAIGNPDEYFKLMEFHDTYAAHLQSGESEQDAFDHASAKLLNTMPNYNMTPHLLKVLSGMGIGPSFVSFQCEVFRNFGYNMYYAQQEIRSGKLPLMRKGIRRLAGTTAVFVSANFVNVLIAQMLMKLKGLGDGEDDEEKRRAFARSLAPGWDRFSNLAFAKLDPDDAVWMNTNYLLPQGSIGTLMINSWYGKSFEKGLDGAMDEFKNQFFGNNVVWSVVQEAITNSRSSTGLKVSTEKGWRNFVQRADHLLRGIYAPGAANLAEKIERMATGHERLGQKSTFAGIMGELLGLRTRSKSTETLALSAFYRIRDERNDADEAAATNAVDNGMDSEDAINRARDWAASLREKVEMLETDLSTIGFTDEHIKKMRKKVLGLDESTFEIKADTDERKAREKEAKALR